VTGSHDQLTYQIILVIVREDVNERIQCLEPYPTAIVTAWMARQYQSPPTKDQSPVLEAAVRPRRQCCPSGLSAHELPRHPCALQDVLNVLLAGGIAQDTQTCPRWLSGRQRPLLAAPEPPPVSNNPNQLDKHATYSLKVCEELRRRCLQHTNG